VPIEDYCDSDLPEEAGYFAVSGAHLYTVLHRVADPLARILLVGSFASERHNSYVPWVRWARYLAARRIEVLRFDYRGVGESTGAFEEMTFEDWCEDVRLLLSWFQGREPDVPVLLHGLELGAILTSIVFQQGSADALLLWAPPANANRVLRSTLSRTVGLEQLFKYGDERRSLSDYIGQLECGSSLDVEGYTWSHRLWSDSFRFQLPPGMSDSQGAAQACNKPVRTVELRRNAAPLVKGGVVGYDEVKDFTWLFAPDFEWITTALALSLQSKPTNFQSGLRENRTRERVSATPRELTKPAIERRMLITLGGTGTLLRGTYHRPSPQGCASQAGAVESSRVGVLFLNSLTLPRTATGDSAVYWADSFAECGYPSFRVDLPGLGDSYGDIKPEVLDFINGGGYASAVSAAVKELTEQFSLAGVVVVGHCAGAVSALYAASISKECVGLVLMDPYFCMRQAVRPKVRKGLSDWASKSSIGGRFSDIFDLLKYFNLFLYRDMPPKNANLPLLRRWSQLTSAGLPLLVLRAPGPKADGSNPRVGEFDYFSYIAELAGRRSEVAFEFVEGTNHSFANRLGRAAVKQTTERWLKTWFPVTARGEAVPNAFQMEIGDLTK
jgi:alpha-beta hydrolase superfamily lysophospholipase